MKNLMVVLIFLNFTLLGQQVPVLGEHEFPEDCLCTCFKIIDACSKKEINLPNVSWTLHCSKWIKGQPLSETVTINSNGRLCHPPGYKSLCIGNTTVCLNAGNWETCGFSAPCGRAHLGCVVEVYQTLSTFPKINGQLLGSGIGTPGESGTFSSCNNSRHTGPLNTPNSATNLNLCPGDQAIFSMEGFSIPDSSGMCLSVAILDENNVTIASAIFGTADVTGNTVDFTNLLSNLPQGVLLQFRFRLTCCNGSQTCSFNSTKTAYFRIVGPSSFSEYAIGGFEPNTYNFLPATSPPGTLLQGGAIIQETNIKVNQFTLVGIGLQNSSITSVNWALRERNCDTGVTGQNLISGRITPQSGKPFNIGPILIAASEDCRCYVLALQYYDECTESLSTKRYFIREGTDCPITKLNDDDDEDEEVAFRIKNLNQSNGLIRLLRNPTDNILMWYIDDSLLHLPLSLSIFDTAGREIKRMQNVNAETLQSIDFMEKDGMYIYQIQAGNEMFTGKFFKVTH